MHYRRLGDTGVVVSELGVGGGGIGQVWGPTTDDDAVAAVDAALAAGVNFFDVAPRYGDGRAERVLGRALEHRREEALVASKVYLGPETLDDIPGAIERGLAESLERLGSDRLDLFQLHNHVTGERGAVRQSLSVRDVLGAGGVVETLQRLKSSGSVRFVGFTGLGDAEAVRTVIRDGGLDTVQAYYNLLNRSAAEPFAAGVGAARPRTDHPAGGGAGDGRDRDSQSGRRRAQRGSRPRRDGGLAGGARRPTGRAAGLPARGGGAAVADRDHRFALSHPQIATVVPGVKNTAEVEDCRAATELAPLDEGRAGAPGRGGGGRFRRPGAVPRDNLAGPCDDRPAHARPQHRRRRSASLRLGRRLGRPP